MNDGTNNSGNDTDSGTVFPEDAGMGGTVSDVPENYDSGSVDTDGVLDSMGNIDDSVTDTETGTENAENNPLDNTQDSVEDAESTTSGRVDYTSDLNHIDSLLYDVRTELQEVQSVSGNSIVVTLDNESVEAIATVQEKQDVIIEGQASVVVLLECVVFALCADYIIHSVKRLMKNITGKKE